MWPAWTLRQVRYAALYRDVHEDGDIAEPGVQVHQGDRLASLLDDGGGQVGRDGCLANSALGAEHREHGAAGYGLIRLAGDPRPLSLLLSEHTLDGVDEILFPHRRDEVIGHSGEHRLADAGGGLNGREGDYGGLRQQVRHGLYGLKRPDHRLLQRDDYDVRLRLLGQGDCFDSVASLAQYREA